MPVGLPGYRWARLRYADNIQMNPTIGAMASHAFSCNSLFDPDITATGHQPMNFDQIALGYQHYTVFSSKIRMTYVKSIVAARIPGVFGVFVDDNQVFTYGTPESIMESNQYASKWLVNSGIEPSTRTVTSYFNAKKFFGVTSLASSIYRPNVGSNPSEGATFFCYIGEIAGNDVDIAQFIIEIEYTALFSELKHVAQS